MPEKQKKMDLRVQKTRNALFAALPALLLHQRFSKITVHDLCEESLVSKTAFYAHFRDKYDLLGQWLGERQQSLQQFFEDLHNQEAEDTLSRLLKTHSTAIANLIEDADVEQQALMFRFFSPQIDCADAERAAVLRDFIAGGIYHVISNYVKEPHRANKEERGNILRTLAQAVAAARDLQAG